MSKSFKIGDIITTFEEKVEAVHWCNDNGCMLTIISEDPRTYVIEDQSARTDAELLEQKRLEATSLEARIAAIEAMLAEVYGGEE